MLAFLTMFALARRTAVQQSPPVFSIGSSADFQQRVFEAETLAHGGDSKGAIAALDKLPGHLLSLSWDDSKAPEELRQPFAEARDDALAAWKRSVPSLQTVLAKDAKLRFDFDPHPSVDASSGLPFKIRLEGPSDQGVWVAHIGLEVGTNRLPPHPLDIESSVDYAVCRLLGVADLKFPGSIADPLDGPTLRRPSPAGYPAMVASANTNLLDQIRQAIESGKAVEPSRAILKWSTGSLDYGSVQQGDQVVKTLTIENTGNGPLQIQVVRSCGCETVEAPKAIDPGKSAPVSFQLSTLEFMGMVDKHLLLLSNDAEQPCRIVTLHVHVEPRFRFLVPDGMIKTFDDRGGTMTVYLTFPSARPLRIKEMDLTGFAGSLDYEPWTGVLPDPELGEGPTQRTGYKFTVNVANKLLQGRTPGTLNLITDDPQFPFAVLTVYAQKGIVAEPEQLNLGEIGAKPAVGTILLTRPNKPFRVLSAKSDLSCLKVSVKDRKAGDEYALDVSYDGSADSGLLTASIKVHTDDPKEPIIAIPVVATVRL
jgi:hypothetical protein